MKTGEIVVVKPHGVVIDLSGTTRPSVFGGRTGMLVNVDPEWHNGAWGLVVFSHETNENCYFQMKNLRPATEEETLQWKTTTTRS